MKPLPNIPAAVREEAERFIAKGNEPGRIARLLITDSRMVAVWRRLRRLKPRPDLWERQESPPADKAEAAMVLVLSSCCLGGFVIDTVAEMHEARDSLGDQAKRLRQEATRLHEHGIYSERQADEVEVQVAALTRVAEWCEKGAAILHEGAIVRDGGVIQRDKGWRDEMGKAEAVAGTMKLLYGRPLYGTVATIVNVITGSLPDENGGGIVLATHVRDWLKAIGTEDNPAAKPSLVSFGRPGFRVYVHRWLKTIRRP